VLKDSISIINPETVFAHKQGPETTEPTSPVPPNSPRLDLSNKISDENQNLSIQAKKLMLSGVTTERMTSKHSKRPYLGT